MNVTTQCNITLTMSETVTLGFSSDTIPSQILPAFALSAGTGTGQNDQHWESQGITLASGASNTYVLSALTDGLGRTVSFAKVRIFLIAVTSRTAGDYLIIGDSTGGGTHDWVAILDSTSNANFKVYDLELKIAVATDGFPVVSGTSDQLKIKNGGSNPITFSIGITGTSV